MLVTTSKFKRCESGSLGALFFAVIVVICIGLGALAVDFAHMLTVRNELQSAADAGSLAGAQDLSSDSSQSAYDHALQVSALNSADARSVSNSSKETQVTVQVVPSVSESMPGTVEVDAQMIIHHLLAPIFGRKEDTIAVKSKAGSYSTTTTLAANQAFPIAVSIDQRPNGPSGKEKALKELHLSDAVTIVIRPDGNPGRNGVWTSFNLGSANTSTYVSLIEQCLGIRPPNAGDIPTLVAGESTINLDNGINRGSGIDTTYLPRIQTKPFLTFPLIEGNQYNQSRPVIGFITIKIKNIEYRSGALVCEGTLVKGIVRGWGGELPSTGNSANDLAAVELSPAVVKLLSASGQ